MNDSVDTKDAAAPLKTSDNVQGYGAARWKSIGDVAGLTGSRGTATERRKSAIGPYNFWTHGRITRRVRPIVEPIIRVLWENCGTISLLTIAAFFLIFAEVIVGLCEAVPTKVLDSVIPVGCSAKAVNDHHLVYMSCPVLYLPDFREVVRGSFVEDIVAGIDLRGLSIHLQTEIYQWVENAVCDDCMGEQTDDKGHCLEPSQFVSCKYTFSKTWVPKPVPSSTFHCQVVSGVNTQKECEWPIEGSPTNVGAIPEALASFRKKAEDGSVSIGDYPARFYLSSAFIEQLPAQSTPLFFKNESLPTVPGYVTTATGNASHEGLHLQRNPGSPQPSIGDLRTRLALEDFYSRDNDRFVTVVAKQVPWTTTAPHRELIPWNSHTRSWTNASDEEVGWLDVGPRSLSDMLAERRAEEYKDGKKLIVTFRVLGGCSLLFAMLLFGGPFAKIWLGMRHWDSWRSSAHDVGMLVALLVTWATAFALIVAAIPLLHFQRWSGFTFLLSALLTMGISAGLLLRLDTTDNLRLVLRISRSHPEGAPADALKASELLSSSASRHAQHLRAAINAANAAAALQIPTHPVSRVAMERSSEQFQAGSGSGDAKAAEETTTRPLESQDPEYP
mmetsp:Transcript_76808/g.136126  ORF Transcript_76808/g.136126 Transcript_76808/m.136126 type:complete len:615 (+) Transcript_76808:81-1925(+)